MQRHESLGTTRDSDSSGSSNNNNTAAAVLQQEEPNKSPDNSHIPTALFEQMTVMNFKRGASVSLSITHGTISLLLQFPSLHTFLPLHVHPLHYPHAHCMKSEHCKNCWTFHHHYPSICTCLRIPACSCPTTCHIIVPMYLLLFLGSAEVVTQKP